MAPTLIPYGKLAGGNYGILIDPASNQPLAASVEVLQAIPDINSADNFDGRMVFIVTLATAYVFSSTPVRTWIPLQGTPAQVGHVNGNPSAQPIPVTGSLYFDLDTGVLFLWDGRVWRGVGGYYAAQIIENVYTGDGVTQNFPTGVPVLLAASYVEVFLNGVRQRQNPSGDYSIAGSTIVLNRAPDFGVKILVRSIVRVAVTGNTQIIVARYVAINGTSTFRSNVAGSDPNRIFVFVNGLVKIGTVDYVVAQQNTIISGIAKITITTARATTVAPHGMIVGQGFTIQGSNQTYYNRPFIVSNIFSATAFDFVVANTAPSTASGNPTMAFRPPSINDNIVFVTPMLGGENIEIRTLKNVSINGAGTGGGNATISLINVGSGTAIALPVLGSVYQIKTLFATPPFQLTPTATDITISLAQPNFFAQTNQQTQWTKRVSGSPTVTLQDSATIIWDMRLGNTFFVAIQGNRIMGLPTNLVDGDTGIIYVQQAGGGSHTISWPATFKFSTGAPPILTTANGAIDMISYSVRQGFIFATVAGTAFA